MKQIKDKTKSKTKKKKWLPVVLIAFVVLLTGGFLTYTYLIKQKDADSIVYDITPAAGQCLEYAQIESIIGNETDLNYIADLTSFTDTGEEESIMIPVGTPVITKLGTETTFSRLAENDVIQILRESSSDEILKIWIIE